MDPEVAALLPTLESETGRTLELLRSDVVGLRQRRNEMSASCLARLARISHTILAWRPIQAADFLGF